MNNWFDFDWVSLAFFPLALVLTQHLFPHPEWWWGEGLAGAVLFVPPYLVASRHVARRSGQLNRLEERLAELQSSLNRQAASLDIRGGAAPARPRVL